MQEKIKNDTVYRQAVIDEIEYELEMINSALDSLTLDFNTCPMCGAKMEKYKYER